MTVEYIPSKNPKYLSFTFWKKINYCCVIKVTQQNIQDFERRVDKKKIYSLSSSKLKKKILKTLNDFIASFTDSESLFKSLLIDNSGILSSLSAYSLLVIGSKSFLPFFVGRLFDEKNKDENIIRETKNRFKIENSNDPDYIKLYKFGESNLLEAQYHNVKENPFFCVVQSFDTTEKEYLYDTYEIFKNSKYIPQLIGSQSDSSGRKFPVLKHNFTTNLISFFEDSILTPTEKSRIIIQILFAIHSMHKQCYFHRDINSLHILIDRFKNAYLQITNQARIYAEPLEAQKNVYKCLFETFEDDVGAQAYISPEQFSTRTYTYVTDIYSFGIITFFLMFNFTNGKAKMKETLNDYSQNILENGFDENKLPKEVKKEIKIIELLSVCLKGKEKAFYRTTALFLLRMIRQRKLYYIGTDEREIERLYAENDEVFQEIKEIDKFPDFQYFKKKVIEDSQTKEFSESFLYLGILYQDGISFEKNLSKAIEYYHISARLGNKNAAYNLGVIYSTEGKYHNPALANEYFQLSSDYGNYMAKYNIANEIRDHQEDKQLVIKLYKEAGEKGFIAEALYNLALIYLDTKDGFKDEALFYFVEAAKLGYIKSYYNAGILYFQKQMFKEAIEYLEIAGEKGISEAYFTLSFLYNENDQRSIDYLKKAADMLNSEAALKLGIFLSDKSFNQSYCYITLSMICSTKEAKLEKATLSFDRIVNKNNEFSFMKKINTEIFNSRKFEELDIFIYKNGRQKFIENCFNDIKKSNLLNIFLRNIDFDKFINTYINYKEPSQKIIDKYTIIAKSEELIKKIQNEEKDECFECGTYLYINNNQLLGIRLLRKAAKLYSIRALKILTFISYQFGLNETFFLTKDDIIQFKNQNESYFTIFVQYFHKSHFENNQKLGIDKPKKENRKLYIHFLFISALFKNEELEFPKDFINEKNVKENNFFNILIDVVNYSIEKSPMNDEIAKKIYYVGKCYIKGKYIQKNILIGEALLKEIANFGDKEALRGLAEIYYCRNYYNSNQNDKNLIIKYFEDADKKQDILSRRRRAIFFLNGYVVNKDESRAVSLMKDQKDPILLFLYGCYLNSKEKYNDAKITFSNCNKAYLLDSLIKLGKLQNTISSILFDFAKFNIGFLTLKTSNSNSILNELNQAYIYFEDSKEFINASTSIMKLYDLSKEYTKDPPQTLLSNIIENTKKQTVIENIVDLIEFIVSFERFLKIYETETKDILLFDQILFIFKSQLEIFESNNMTYLSGITNFYIGCIIYRQNKYSEKAETYFINSTKFNEVSGYLNLARIYRDNVLFENQEKYLSYYNFAISTNEGKLEYGLMHLIGKNGQIQNFDLAMHFFREINFDLDISRKIENKRKSLDQNFYNGFGINLS